MFDYSPHAVLSGQPGLNVIKIAAFPSQGPAVKARSESLPWRGKWLFLSPANKRRSIAVLQVWFKLDDIYLERYIEVIPISYCPTGIAQL